MSLSARAATIRIGLKPGDLGAIVRLHGLVYSEEHGFDETFEPYVARPLADVVEAGPDGGRIWIAETADNEIAGTIAIVKTDPAEAQLRWFILAPTARGRGLGRRLCEAAMAFVDEQSISVVSLWSFVGLGAAMHLYREVGFRETERRNGTLGGRVVRPGDPNGMAAR